jgi:alcohol dehydrogenase
MKALVYLGPGKLVFVHGVQIDLHLVQLWNRNITITTRLVDTTRTPMLLNTVAARKLSPGLLISHRFKFAQMLEAYRAFGQAATTHALKVVIEA